MMRIFIRRHGIQVCTRRLLVSVGWRRFYIKYDDRLIVSVVPSSKALFSDRMFGKKFFGYVVRTGE